MKNLVPLSIFFLTFLLSPFASAHTDLRCRDQLYRCREDNIKQAGLLFSTKSENIVLNSRVRELESQVKELQQEVSRLRVSVKSKSDKLRSYKAEVYNLQVKLKSREEHHDRMFWIEFIFGIILLICSYFFGYMEGKDSGSAPNNKPQKEGS
jgi:septal ring factor EnvC (AmiA/AmiB activator)